MKSFSKRIRFPHFWSLTLVVSFGFLTTLLLAIFVNRLEQQTLEAQFVQFAEDDIFAIHTSLNWYLEPLEAVAAFYSASVAINRHEFSTFVKPFLVQRPGIAAIQWIPCILEDQRVAYETAARQEPGADGDRSPFTFTEYEQTKEGKPSFVPATPRAAYYPIYYQEPMPQDGMPLGFDLGSDPIYRQALTTARDQGQGVAVEQPALAEKRTQHPLVIQIFYPIYAAGGAADTPQIRTRSLIGFIAIVLRVHEVIDRILRDIPPDDIDLAIYEHFTDPTPRLLYRNPPISSSTSTDQAATFFTFFSARATETLLVVKPLTPLSQQWQLVLQPTAAYLATNGLWYHWFVWACGLCGTTGVALYLSLVLNRNRAAEIMVRDRTEQLRQANAQLQATLQELQFQKSLLECTSEAAQDGMLVASLDHKWLFFNQRFVDMWQIPQEIVDRRIGAEGIQWIVQQVANPQQARENIKQLYANPTARASAEIALKNGAIYERFSAPVQRTDGFIDARVWYFRDISQRKRAEAALQASQQQLQERQQHEKAVVEEELTRVRNQLVAHTRLATLGQVAATIAHELRNPLGAVRNAVYYMRRYIVKDQQDLLEFLQIIDSEVSTADRIITDLLEMSRAKEPGLQPLDVCAMTRAIWPQIAQQGLINFQCVVTQEPFWVWADATQLRQIFINLMTNAVQAMPHGGDLSIRAVYQDNDVVITIQDSGPGIPPALREQIFEPLFTTKAKGTGLGLTLCRQIMEKHDGSIKLVDSDQGASFELRFPYKPGVGAV